MIKTYALPGEAIEVGRLEIRIAVTGKHVPRVLVAHHKDKIRFPSGLGLTRAACRWCDDCTNSKDSREIRGEPSRLKRPWFFHRSVHPIPSKWSVICCFPMEFELGTTPGSGKFDILTAQVSFFASNDVEFFPSGDA